MTKSKVEDFQFSWGSNYGMDGYSYDMDYGSGIRDRQVMKDRQTPKNEIVLPGAATLHSTSMEAEPSLPSGEETSFSKEAFDLSGTDAVAKRTLGTPIVDHSWFTTAEQDPNRLPKNSKMLSLVELQDLWGTRTNGIRRETLSDPRYAQPFAEPPKKTFPVHSLAGVIAQAMRRSAAGQEIDIVIKEAELNLGNHTSKYRLPLLKVQQEHGLAGRVFIRASAYPGCYQGKWTKQVQRHASGAKYVLQKKECAGCPMNLEGNCMALGAKQIVASVPWEEAVQHYAPNASSKLSPQENIRQAFQPVPEAPREQTPFPIQPDPLQNISSKEASAQLRAYQPKKSVLKTAAEFLAEKQKKASQDFVASLVEKGFLSSNERTALFQKNLPPPELRKAASWIVQSKTQSKVRYEGPIVKAALQVALRDCGIEEAQRRFAASLEIEARKKLLESFQKASSQIDLWVKMGHLQSEDASILKNSGSSPQEMLDAAKTLAFAPKETRKFSGLRMVSHQDRNLQITTAKDVSDALIQVETRRRATAASLEKAKVKSQAKQKLSGLRMAFQRGADLASLKELISRFSSEERQEVKADIVDLLQNVRSPHQKSARTYNGKVYKEALRVPVPQTRNATELQLRKASIEALTWLNRGLVGEALHRAMGPQPENVWQVVKKAEQEHGGLAGRLYIAAEAHASLGPVTGCERGAAMYKEIQAPLVLKAPQCEGCVFQGPGKGPHGRCVKYGRDLVSASDLLSKGPLAKRVLELKEARLQKRQAGATLSSPQEDSFWGDISMKVSPKPKRETSTLEVDLPLPSLGDI